MELQKLYPECKDNVWGGTKLKEKYGKQGREVKSQKRLRKSSICLSVVTKKEQKEQEQRRTKNFSELMNDSNLQIQEARQAG